MTRRHITIATRESPLALCQANIIKESLQKIYPHLSVDLLGITTQADKMLNLSLAEIGGKGLFLKELEEALIAGKADIAVHSMKDVPMELPPGLIIPIITEREDPRDAFVSNDYQSLMQLPTGSRIGTSSLRRQTQISALRNDLILELLRGNVNTRLAKLDHKEFDAIILASAGLKRLGFASRIKQYLSTDDILPSAGQGALGIECREDDAVIKTLIAPLNDVDSFSAVSAERAVCRVLNGGCKVPVAAFAHIHHHELKLKALVANEKGTRILRAERTGKPQEAESIGKRVAEELLQQGAERILREFHVK